MKIRYKMGIYILHEILKIFDMKFGKKSMEIGSQNMLQLQCKAEMKKKNQHFYMSCIELGLWNRSF